MHKRWRPFTIMKRPRTKFKEKYLDSAIISIAQFTNVFSVNSTNVFLVLTDICNNKFYTTDIDKLIERLKNNLKTNKFNEVHGLSADSYRSIGLSEKYLGEVQATFFEYYISSLVDELIAFDFDKEQHDKIIKSTFTYWFNENQPYSKAYKFKGVFGHMNEVSSKGSLYRIIHKKRIDKLYDDIDSMNWVKGYIDNIINTKPFKFGHIENWYLNIALTIKDDLASLFISEFRANVKMYWGLLGHFEGELDADELGKYIRDKNTPKTATDSHLHEPHP